MRRGTSSLESPIYVRGSSGTHTVHWIPCGNRRTDIGNRNRIEKAVSYKGLEAFNLRQFTDATAVPLVESDLFRG